MRGWFKAPEDVRLTKEILGIRWDKLLDDEPRWNVPPTAPVPVVTSAGARSQPLRVTSRCSI